MTYLSRKWQFGKMRIQEYLSSIPGEYVVKKVENIFLTGGNAFDKIGSDLISRSRSEDYQDSLAILEEMVERVKSIPTESEDEVELRTTRTSSESPTVKVLYLASLCIHHPDANLPPFLSFFFSSPKLPYYVLTIYKLVMEIPST